MSDSAPPANTCPQCGAIVATGAPEGLCPRCVAAVNLCADTAMAGATEVGAQSAPAPDEIAAHFPQLEVIEFLGRGGMGVVYKARQKALGRLVALKLLAPERVEDPKFAERFAHEAKALAALNHPNIVTIHDFGQAGGYFYLLMEFVDGVNLRQAMKAGRFTPEQALAIVPPVCEALQYAHEHGIVHRDIKPENLLLARDGRVKIADFGIAKILGAEASGIGLAESQPAGTPQYMAPEQKEHRITDHRADIYSLGVVLYEMLTGELPSDKLQPPSKRVQVDVRIDEIVLRALEVKPELRFQTAADFRTGVENVKGEKATAQSAAPNSKRAMQFRLVEERDGRRVIVWRGVLGAAFAVFAITLVIGAAMSLVAKGAPPFVIVVAFAGIAALLTVGSSVRISLKSGASPHSEPDDTTGPPRFSRAAIVGACWVPVIFVSFVAVALISYQGLGRPSPNPAWWQLLLLIPALIMGVAGPFGTTILGWVAVAQIRRSAGRILGLQLALFDGLVFPLITLGAIVAVAVVALAKMFVEFYANPSVIGDPHIHPPLITRMANWLSLNKEVAVIVGVIAAIVVNVLIVRAVLRAVRREVPSAPPETRAIGNEIQVASIAMILALIATALGALAVVRNAGAWPAMAFSLLFAGMSILMALPVRRLAAGKCALIIAALGTVIWPAIALVVQRGRVGADVNGSGIERVEVAEDRAVISQPRYDLEGMIITFGPAANRWTPSGVYLEAMFDVTLEPHWIGRGANWVMKPRHGIISSYRLDGPPGPMLGKIVFHPGTPKPKPDGSYVIGEFRPDKGGPLPIAVKVERDPPSNAFPAGEHVGRNHLSVVATYNQTATELHYVLFYDGDFANTASSGSQNLAANTWVDEGAVKLKNGRTFGYRREALYPDELHINGTAYDLRKGRVIVLRDDGVTEQFRFFPSVATARDPEEMSRLIRYEEAAPKKSGADKKQNAKMIPDHIEFRVTRVENPPGSRVIAMHFERDKNYGLGLEFSQDVIAASDGKAPKSGYRDWRQKMFLGASDSGQFAWELLEEFSTDEARSIAKEVENRGREMSQLPDGALIEFAKVKHREGWTYVLLARVRREWGAPYPPAPPGANYTFEKLVIVPNGRTVRLALLASANDQAPQPVGDPLYFKTPPDRTSGFLLRWHAYDASADGHGEQPSRVLIDIADPDTGVAYHRFEHGFGLGARFKILEVAPLPDKNPSVMLVEPGRSTTLHLLAAEKVGPPGAAIVEQWHLLADVGHVSRDEVNAIPRFQMPPTTGFQPPPAPTVPAPTGEPASANYLELDQTPGK